MSVICPRCESENPPTLRYCDYCEYELRSEDPTPTVHEPATPKDQDNSPISEGIITDDARPKVVPIIEHGPFSQTERRVGLGTFLNVHLAGFSAENVQDIAETKRRVTGVTELDLSDCELKDLPESLCLLMRLEFIDVSGNKFETVPVVLITLTSVKKLGGFTSEVWTLYLKRLTFVSSSCKIIISVLSS